jgi:hypothetical protein
VEAGQRQEWKDIADRSPTYKRYCAQWKSLVVRDGVLERLWQSADGRIKTAQVVIPRSKVKEVRTEMHGGPSGGHFGISKTLDKVRQRYYWLHSRDDVESWCQQLAEASRTRTLGLMHQYNVGAPFERIAMDISGPFHRATREPVSPVFHALHY